MSAINGQPAPKPGSLGRPVPGANEQDEADAFVANYTAPKAAAPAADPEVDSFVSSYGADAPMIDDASVPPEDNPDQQFAHESAGGSIPEQLQNFATRLVTSLGANDKVKLGYLQKKFGSQNATMHDGKLYFRREGESKFKPLDPDTTEIISDFIGDWSREAVTEVAMVPGEIIGGVMGAIAGSPAGPPGIVGGAGLGAYTGRVASVPMANAAADKVAGWMGVPQDDERNIGGENLAGMATEAVLPLVGKYVAKPLAKQIVKRIPGTAEYALAKEAGKKEAVALSEQSKEVVQALEDLKQQGTHLEMMSSQIHPDSPQLATAVGKAEQAHPGQFMQKQMEVAEGYNKAVENTLGEIKRLGGEARGKGSLAEIVTNGVETLEKAQGAAIGSYRAKALAKLKNEKQQIPQEFSQQAMELMQQLGFTRKATETKSAWQANLGRGSGGVKTNVTYRMVPPRDMNALVGQLGMDPAQARGLVNSLDEIGKHIADGNSIRLTDLEKLIDRVGPLNDMLRGTKAGNVWGGMTSQLRQFRREVIGNSLDSPVEKKLFNAVMDDYSLIREGAEQLRNVLNDDFTAKAMVSSVFTGKQNLAKVRAIKQIAGEKSPEWAALREEFVNQLMLKHGDRASKTGYKSGAMLDDLQKNYGDEFIREVLPGEKLAELKNLLTVGERIEQTWRGVKTNKMNEKAEKAAADATIGFLGGIKFKMINGVQNLIGASGGSEHALMELFNRNGYEKYLTNYKGDKGKAAQVIEAMLARYNAARAQSKVLQGAETVGKAGAEVGKRVIRGGIKQDVQESQ